MIEVDRHSDRVIKVKIVLDMLVFLTFSVSKDWKTCIAKKEFWDKLEDEIVGVL